MSHDDAAVAAGAGGGGNSNVNDNNNVCDEEGQKYQREQHHQHHLAILICSANIGNAEPTCESFGAWIPNDGELLVGEGDRIGDCDSDSDSDTDGGGDKYDVLDGGDVNEETIELIGGQCDAGVRRRRPDALAEDEAACISNPRNLNGGGRMKQKKKFDIIVIGMQEAAFINENSAGSSSSKEFDDGTTSSNNDNCDRNVEEGSNEDGNNTNIDADCDGNEEEGTRGNRSGDGDETTNTTRGVLGVLDMANDGIVGIKKESEKSRRRVMKKIGRGNLVMRGLGLTPPTAIPRTLHNA